MPTLRNSRRPDSSAVSKLPPRTQTATMQIEVLLHYMSQVGVATSVPGTIPTGFCTREGGR